MLAKAAVMSYIKKSGDNELYIIYRIKGRGALLRRTPPVFFAGIVVGYLMTLVTLDPWRMM